MGKKSSGVSKMSSGKMAGIRKARAERRQAKFAAKREVGKAYKYQSIEEKTGAKEDTPGYIHEQNLRIQKAKSSKTEYAQWTSINAKLDNELHKKALENKAKKGVKSEK